MGNVGSVGLATELLAYIDSLFSGEIGPMKQDPWSIVSALVILGGLLKVIHRLIRHSRNNRKAVTAVTAESKRESVSFFSTSIIALTIAFGALLLLIVNAQQTSPSSRALSILAAGVAALVLFDALVLVIGIPAYNFTTNLKQGHQSLEKKVEELRQQNQHLAEKVEALEARNQTTSLAQQLPVPRKPCSRKKSPQTNKVSTSRRRIDKKDKTEGRD